MIKRLTSIISFSILIIETFPIANQTNISISIDDAPNTIKFQQDNFQSILLNKLDLMAIPITIFINKGLINKTDSISKNFKLLNDWILPNFIAVGRYW